MRTEQRMAERYRMSGSATFGGTIARCDRPLLQESTAHRPGGAAESLYLLGWLDVEPARPLDSTAAARRERARIEGLRSAHRNHRSRQNASNRGPLTREPGIDCRKPPQASDISLPLGGPQLCRG